MKHKFLIILIFALFFLFAFFNKAFAIDNPLASPNNKFGVHILFPEEIREAGALVNSNNGDWGYVTIPIQAGDRDLIKWQKFMDEARRLHVIPIVRIATEGDYFNTKVWRKPTDDDVLDFANFLDSLEWPTKNRYVVIFNEVNRSDEWGGEVNPSEYAEILQYAVSFFKSKNQDFFVISGGLDNASPNSLSSMDEYKFMRDMENATPGIFSQIDGMASHAYPNPGFSQPPSVLTSKSIASFKFEKKLADELSQKNLPVFITETGWSKDAVNDSVIASYYNEAFKSVWNDENIVAVTPFLLRGSGPFLQFSLIGNDGQDLAYKTLKKLEKTKGNPKLSESTFTQDKKDQNLLIPTRNFLDAFGRKENDFIKLDTVKTILKWLIKT